MSTELNHMPGGENSNQTTSGEQENSSEENVQISQPQIERPEGPFPHSGETSGWTKEEEEEKLQGDNT